MSEQLFYKMCPCGAISGFFLPKTESKKKYYCQKCGKCTPLDKWTMENQSRYKMQEAAKTNI